MILQTVRNILSLLITYEDADEFISRALANAVVEKEGSSALLDWLIIYTVHLQKIINH